MEMLFDHALIDANRLRALRSGPADFLLDVVAQELGERLSVVDRRFERAVELHGHTGAVARAIAGTGRVDAIERVESDDRFANSGERMTVSPLETVPLEPQSANLIVSPLALHLTNDTPGIFVQIRRALKPDGLFLAAIPGSGTLQELREVLLTAESELTGGASPRVIPFPDVRDVGALLQRGGFALPVTDKESYRSATIRSFR